MGSRFYPEMERRRRAATRGAVQTKQTRLAVGDARKCSTHAVFGFPNGNGGSTTPPPLPPTSRSGRGVPQYGLW
uniref:Uncharacterized protein n=1 Tax=Oryza glumipatula TaxID=40148 RepID=A0A0E0AU17_9ORYZ